MIAPALPNSSAIWSITAAFCSRFILLALYEGRPRCRRASRAGDRGERRLFEFPPSPGLPACAAGGLGLRLLLDGSLEAARNYAATASSMMSRVRDGSTRTPGPIVEASV